jgi:hypothetical protein
MSKVFIQGWGCASSCRAALSLNPNTVKKERKKEKKKTYSKSHIAKDFNLK